MNIRRFINKNTQKIWHVILVVVMTFFAIKLLNGHYENEEAKKLELFIQNQEASKIEEKPIQTFYTQSDSIKVTMSSFVNFCNNGEIEKAYEMLTEDCKNAMFPTIENFEKIYVNKIYKTDRIFKLEKWYQNGSLSTYLVTLYGDILATGNTNDLTQEYYTFVEGDNGIYKLNINNYIYGQKIGKSKISRNVEIEVENVDIYNDYMQMRLIVKNNSDKKILLNGDRYNESIYLQNSSGKIYTSKNSMFDTQEIVIQPKETEILTVEFNKVYGPAEAITLIINDIIIDYDAYINSGDLMNYSDRMSMKIGI